MGRLKAGDGLSLGVLRGFWGGRAGGKGGGRGGFHLASRICRLQPVRGQRDQRVGHRCCSASPRRCPAKAGPYSSPGNRASARRVRASGGGKANGMNHMRSCLRASKTLSATFIDYDGRGLHAHAYIQRQREKSLMPIHTHMHPHDCTRTNIHVNAHAIYTKARGTHLILDFTRIVSDAELHIAVRTWCFVAPGDVVGQCGCALAGERQVGCPRECRFLIQNGENTLQQNSRKEREMRDVRQLGDV